MNQEIMIKTKRNEDTIYIFNNDFKDIEKVKEVCFNNSMNINDYEYKMLNQALEYINEALKDIFNPSTSECFEAVKDRLSDFIDSHIEVYTHNLLKWVLSTGTEFTDLVLDEDSETQTTFDLLSRGYGLHLEKMFFIALEILRNLNK